MEFRTRRSFLDLLAWSAGIHLTSRVVSGHSLASSEGRFPQKWKIHTGLEHHGVVIGKVDGQERIFIAARIPWDTQILKIPGAQHPPRAGLLLAMDGSGRLVFITLAGTAGISVFPNFLEIRGLGPCVFYACGPGTEGSLGEVRLVSARDGHIIWRGPTTTSNFANGSCVLGDIDGDGQEELVYADEKAVYCVRPTEGKVKWVYSDRVAICHGRLAGGDINGDGKAEVVLGTAYSNADGSSAMLALDASGRLLWRKDGIVGDMGSTPAVIFDIDGDQKPEVLKVEYDLVGRGKMPWSGLYCFRSDGSLKYRADFGCGGMAVGDLDGDGIPEAVGVTDGRDGGTHGKKEIRCFSLKTGSLKWATPINRAWLGCQDPVMADLTGKGEWNVLLTTNNPSGYGRLKSAPPYGDAYVVNQRGEIIWQATFPDYIPIPFVSDVDGDGRNEMILACHDGTIYCYGTPGKAGRLWSVTGGNFRRTYATQRQDR